MKKIWVVLALFFASFGLAAELPTVAVYHFDNETTKDMYRLSENTLRNIEEKLRSELIKTQKFKVMSEKHMDNAIKEHIKESRNMDRDLKYQLELGRKISARYIITGKIRNEKNDYTIFAEITDTETFIAAGAGNEDFINEKSSLNKATASIVKQLLSEGSYETKTAKPMVKSDTEAACKQARAEGTIDAWESFIEAFSSEEDAEECIEEAYKQLEEIAYKNTKAKNTVEAWEKYIEKYQNSNKLHLMEAKKQIKKLEKENGGSRKKDGIVAWSEPIMNKTWNEASEYCQNLEEGGHNDWRLPTVDEYRSTFQNCPATQPDGQCQISEKNGKIDSGSFHKICKKGCRAGTSTLSGKGWFWSASGKSGTNEYWVVSFQNARISFLPMNTKSNFYCVR